MGLRDKVALLLVTVIILQITSTYSMPPSKKAALKRYLDNNSQDKSSFVPKSSLSTGSIKPNKSLLSKCNKAKIIKDVPNKSMYKVYNFPETEYPLDNSPRDPFYLGTNINCNPLVGLDKEATTSQSKIINDLKKEMRMKRKLNRFSNNEHKTKVNMPSLNKYSTEPTWLKDQEIFPQVEYPMTAMETWGPHYWNPSLFTQQCHQSQNFEYPTLDQNLDEKSTIFYKPKKYSKSKTQQYIEEIDKIKEKIRKTTSNSKPVMDTNKMYAKNESSCSDNSDKLLKTDAIEKIDTKEAFVNKEDKCGANTDILENSQSKDLNTQPVITTLMDDVQSTTPVESDNKTQNAIAVDETDKSNVSTSSGTSLVRDDADLPILTKEISDDAISPTLSDNQVLFDEVFPNNEVLITNDTGETDPSEDIVDSSSPLMETNLEESNSPFNVNIPIPLLNKPDDYSKTETTDKANISNVDKIPYTSVIVVPVGDSIKTVTLPVIKNSSGAPIIVFVPATHNSETPKFSNPASVTPPIPSDHVRKSNVDHSSISIIPISSETQPNEMLSNPVTYNTETPLSPSNTVTLLPDCEILPINSMCHETADHIFPLNDTLQDDPMSDELFLEMLQPIIVITNTSPSTEHKMEDPLAIIGDDATMTRPSDQNDDFTTTQQQDTKSPDVLLPSVTEIIPSDPDTETDFIPVEQLTTTSLGEGHRDNDEDIAPALSLFPLEKEQLHPDVYDSHVLNENIHHAEEDIDIRDISAPDNNDDDDLPMPMDIVLPMDIVIEMIKNGTLLPVHKLLDTPVMNIEDGLIGPIVDVFAESAPTDRENDEMLPDGQIFYATNGPPSDKDEVVDFSQNIFMAPQAMELRDTAPSISLIDTSLPKNEPKEEQSSINTDSTDDVLSKASDEVIQNKQNDDISQILQSDSNIFSSTEDKEEQPIIYEITEDSEQSEAEKTLPDESVSEMDDEKRNTADIDTVKGGEIPPKSDEIQTTLPETSQMSEFDKDSLDEEIVYLTETSLRDSLQFTKAVEESPDTVISENVGETLLPIDSELLENSALEITKDLDENTPETALPTNMILPETTNIDTLEDTDLDEEHIDSTFTDSNEESSAFVQPMESSLFDNASDPEFDEIPVSETKMDEIIREDKTIPQSIEQPNTAFVQDALDTVKVDDLPLPIDDNPTDSGFIGEESLMDKETGDILPSDSANLGAIDPIDLNPKEARSLTAAELKELFKYLYLAI